MLSILKARWQQGFRTTAYPAVAPVLPDRFRGRPELAAGKCPEQCRLCVEHCPAGACARDAASLTLDTGRCLFCAACAGVCPTGAITFTRDHRLAARRRDDLRLAPGLKTVAAAFHEEAARLFGRSLKLRQVSAGGCNACEADVNVLNTVGFDLGQFGIQFVASPRHADGLLITGPVPENMREALRKTYDAVPSPRIVVAVGSCAIAGGPYRDHPEVHNGADSQLPVDLYIPGCPPHPYTILDGLLRCLGRIPDRQALS